MLIEQQKKQLRFSFRQRALLHLPQDSAFLVERLNENLNYFLDGQSGIWAAFKGLQHEPNLASILAKNKSIQWVYPRVVGDDLEFVSSNEFSSGAFGLAEPIGGQVISKDQIKGFLTPGVAFDHSGCRLGRGKGYYDRVLSGTVACKVGICFGYQIFSEPLPKGALDISMDILISEQGIWDCKNLWKGK